MAPADPEAALIASGSEEEEGRPAAAGRGPWGWRGLVVAGLSAAILGASVSVEGCGGGEGGVVSVNGTNITFGHTPERGGRITSLKLDGTPILVEGKGSTFWPAPKSSWVESWPPPASIAEGTYYVNETNDTGTVLMTSQPDEDDVVQVQKSFTLDTESERVVLRYTVTGLNETEVKKAGWEVTFVPAGGLSFWKTGPPAPVYGGFGTPLMEEIGGVTYVDHSDANITEDGAKVSMKSPGTWMAHATNETLFVKVFPSVEAGDVAPNEGNIAYFARPTFASLESQGPYTAATKDSPITYVVCWFVRPLPEGAAAIKGDEKLLAEVTKIAKLGCPTA